MVTVVLAWAMGFKAMCEFMDYVVELLCLLDRLGFFQKLSICLCTFKYEFPRWVCNWSVDDAPKYHTLVSIHIEHHVIGDDDFM